MEAEMEIVKFHNDEIKVFSKNCKYYVALKPICDAIGLGWGSQTQSIKKHPVLSSVLTHIVTTGADGKQYDMLCIELDYINGWLFKVNPAKLGGEVKGKVILYQRECYRVLAEHFKPAQSKIASQLPPFEAALEKTRRQIASLRIFCRDNNIDRKTCKALAPAVFTGAPKLLDWCARMQVMGLDELLEITRLAFNLNLDEDGDIDPAELREYTNPSCWNLERAQNGTLVTSIPRDHKRSRPRKYLHPEVAARKARILASIHSQALPPAKED
jgi:hypothetical protein